MDLKVAIMSRGPRLYSTRRLVEEAKKRNLEVEVTDPMKFSLLVDDGKIDPTLLSISNGSLTIDRLASLDKDTRAQNW